MSIAAHQHYEQRASLAGIAVPIEMSGAPIRLMDEGARYNRMRPDTSIEAQVRDTFENVVFASADFTVQTCTLEPQGAKEAPAEYAFDARSFRGLAAKLFRRSVATETFTDAIIEAVAPSEVTETTVNSALAKASYSWVAAEHLEQTLYMRVSANVHVRNRYVGKSACLAILVPDNLAFTSVVPRLYTAAYRAPALKVLEQEAASLGQ